MKSSFNLLMIILFGISICYAQKIKKYEIKNYTIIKYSPKLSQPQFENAKPTKLVYKELIELENIISNKISKNLKEHKYFRQYVAVENQNGDKLVWINFFCLDYYDTSYRTSIMSAADGGNCIFQVKVNLTKKDCYYFQQNSEG